MTGGNPLLNLGGISKPATVLIEKISDAVGGYFKPYQIKRVAKAEAEAELIKAEAHLHITDLHRRAVNRFIAEEAKKQENVETITEKAIPQLEVNSKPEDMEEDWITNFFDKCRIVSDDEMQTLWAKVLAGEANSPGTYSKRTVNFLGSLDKSDAHLFTSLCGFAWFIGDVVPFIFDVQQTIYNDQGINFDTLSHLDDIGLVSFNNLAGFKRLKLPKKTTVLYYGTSLHIEFSKDDGNELELGRVLLTRTGQQLAKICGSKPVAGFTDYVIERWVKKGLVLSSPYSRSK